MKGSTSAGTSCNYCSGIAGYARHNLAQTSDFALMVVGGNTLWIAAKEQCGSVSWPADVVLMQNVVQNGVFIADHKLCVYGANSEMAKGMADHLKAIRTHHPTAPQADPRSPSWRLIKNIKIASASAIVNVKRTNSFVNTSIAAPNVNLMNDGADLHRLYLMAAFRLVARNVRAETGCLTDGHNIAALMVDGATGGVVAGATNTKAVNGTFHAEVNLLQTCASANVAFPAQPIVYTTMKPCNMCAAMIKEVLPNCTVIYFLNDPNATNTLLPMVTLEQIQAKPLKHVGASKTLLTSQMAFSGNAGLCKYVDKSSGIFRAVDSHLLHKASKYAKRIDNDNVTISKPDEPFVLHHLSKVLEFSMKDPWIWKKLCEPSARPAEDELMEDPSF